MTDEERKRIEQTLATQVARVSHELDVLAAETRFRMNLSSRSEGYYWDNFREEVIKIRSAVNRLEEWFK